MSRKPENTFITGVERHLPPNRRGCYRMKNSNDFIAGIADKWYSGARDLWIEYKYVEVPARAGTAIHLIDGADPAISPLQQEWLRDRHAEGRNVWVIVGSKTGGVVFRGLDWQQPITAGGFAARIKERKALASEILTFINP